MTLRTRSFPLLSLAWMALTVAAGPLAGQGPAEPLYREVTDTHLPPTTGGPSMDAGVADIDGDGDLDIVVAVEFERNMLLLNNGRGVFTDASTELLPGSARDSEDVGIADFDGDGDLDIAFVSEDDQVNELWINQGAAGFEATTDRIPLTGISNALVVSDVDGDGSPDLIVGNRGRDFVLLNDGRGFFTDARNRMPNVSGVTQDLELGDVDGDGDLDLLYGSEGDNSLLINDGQGFFENESRRRIPSAAGPERTREADFGDVDGDGDLDIFYANVEPGPGGTPQDRLLINDGEGVFADETAARLPADSTSAFEGDLIDLDGDGDLDIVVGIAFGGSGFEALLNDGAGFFSLGTDEVFGARPLANGFDVEQADFDGDGRPDLYLASRFGTDRLFLASDRVPRQVACGDLRKLKVAMCKNGRLSAKLILRNRSRNGARVSVGFDGEVVTARVRGKKAKVKACCFEAGDHVVELLVPAGCFAPVARSCEE